MCDGPIPPNAEGPFLLPKLRRPKPSRITYSHEKCWRCDTHKYVQHPNSNVMAHFQTRKKGDVTHSSSRSKISAKTYLIPNLAPSHQGSSRASSPLHPSHSSLINTSRDQTLVGSRLQPTASLPAAPPCPQAAIHKIKPQQKTHTQTSTHTSNRRKTILLTALSFPRYLKTLIC